MGKKGKPKAIHWGFRDSNGVHTLCGKESGALSCFNEYGDVCTKENRITCKKCVEALCQQHALGVEEQGF